MPLRLVLACVALAPLIASGQPVLAIAQLRSQALTEGSVEVKVTTRALVDAATSPTNHTQAQRLAIHLAQQRILLELVPRGLVVGNAINVQPDGSFTMRVLPEALEHLAASTAIAALGPAATKGVGQ